MEALQQVQKLAAADVEGIRRSMAGGKYDISMAVQQIEIQPSGRVASARGVVTRVYRPRGGREQPDRRTSEFTLERQGDGWVIQRIR